MRVLRRRCARAACVELARERLEGRVGQRRRRDVDGVFAARKVPARSSAGTSDRNAVRGARRRARPSSLPWPRRSSARSSSCRAAERGARGARTARRGRRESARTRASAARSRSGSGSTTRMHAAARIAVEQRVGELHRADLPALRLDVDGTRRIERFRAPTRASLSNDFCVGCGSIGQIAQQRAAMAAPWPRGRAPARPRGRARR